MFGYMYMKVWSHRKSTRNYRYFVIEVNGLAPNMLDNTKHIKAIDKLKFTIDFYQPRKRNVLHFHFWILDRVERHIIAFSALNKQIARMLKLKERRNSHQTWCIIIWTETIIIYHMPSSISLHLIWFSREFRWRSSSRFSTFSYFFSHWNCLIRTFSKLDEPSSISFAHSVSSTHQIKQKKAN